MAYTGYGPSPIERSFWKAAKPRIPELQRECQIGKKYRVDFLLPSRKVVIELYGFRYHRTKEKLTSDAERERDLQGRGYQVIRFTGSEITKDVDRCVNDVLAIINGNGSHSLGISGTADPEDRPWRLPASLIAPVSVQGAHAAVKGNGKGAVLAGPPHASPIPLSASANPRRRMFTSKQVAILAAMATAAFATIVTLLIAILVSTP
jgi:very-short-patch-repair endonuclease